MPLYICRDRTPTLLFDVTDQRFAIWSETGAPMIIALIPPKLSTTDAGFLPFFPLPLGSNCNRATRSLPSHSLTFGAGKFHFRTDRSGGRQPDPAAIFHFPEKPGPSLLSVVVVIHFFCGESKKKPTRNKQNKKKFDNGTDGQTDGGGLFSLLAVPVASILLGRVGRRGQCVLLTGNS